jgi:class 3 adenylate cyclase
MDTFPAALMVADVSGFTALTEALGARGSAGVELLTKCMNRYFTQVGCALGPGCRAGWRGGCTPRAG